MADWLSAMAQLGAAMLRVLRYDGRSGEAAVVNFAASHARGEYLLTLSPRSVICAGDWLAELLNHAQRPEVGVVGARLLGSNGAIVSAGLILGLAGPATSPSLGEHASTRGYMQRLQVAQNWSAVSSDCLMVRKEVFDSLGQLDEAQFNLGLGGVDLCLEADKKNGYLIVWTPFATVMMGEDASPAASQAHVQAHMQAQVLEHETFYKKKWLPKISRDAAYNPALSLGVASFSLEPSLRNNWNPFRHRDLPLILGLPVNESAIGHYRVTAPLAELEAAGRVIARVAYESPSNVEIERLSPDTIILQGRYNGGSAADILRMKKYSSALRIFRAGRLRCQHAKKNSHARNKPVNTEQMLRDGIALCDRVVVTTQALADVLSSMHSEIRVVPNMLPPAPWATLTSQRRTSKKTTGWLGRWYQSHRRSGDHCGGGP